MNESSDDERDAIARLLRQAGRREDPPEDAARRIYSQVRAVWEEQQRKRRQRRVAMAWAASLAVLAVGVWLAAPLLLPGSQVARIARVEGDVSRGGTSHEALRPQMAVESGDRIETGRDGGVVLERTGASGGTLMLRLDAGSALVWVSADEIRLEQGQLYLDTGRQGEAAPLQVVAGQTRIEHVGTQYSVALDEQQLRVAVRDGIVRVATAAGTSTLSRGEQARVDVQSGAIERAVIDTHGDSWAWVDALSPSVTIEGRSLRDVLSTLAYEAGFQLAYASPDVEVSARGTILHGPQLEISPSAAIDTVLATTSFRAVRSGAQLRIEAR